MHRFIYRLSLSIFEATYTDSIKKNQEHPEEINQRKGGKGKATIKIRNAWHHPPPFLQMEAQQGKPIYTKPALRTNQQQQQTYTINRNPRKGKRKDRMSKEMGAHASRTNAGKRKRKKKGCSQR